MNWKKYGRKESQPNLRCCTSICQVGLRKSRKSQSEQLVLMLKFELGFPRYKIGELTTQPQCPDSVKYKWCKCWCLMLPVYSCCFFSLSPSHFVWIHNRLIRKGVLIGSSSPGWWENIFSLNLEGRNLVIKVKQFILLSFYASLHLFHAHKLILQCVFKTYSSTSSHKHEFLQDQNLGSQTWRNYIIQDLCCTLFLDYV